MSNTGELKLVWGVTKAPRPAPHKVLRQVETEAQALAVSIAASNLKLAYVAAAIGVSIDYVSKMRAGKRPIPNRLVMPLCTATGSLLLAQYIELQRAIEGVSDVERLAELMRAAA